MEFEQLLNDISQGNQTTLLVIQVFVVVFAALLLDFIQKRLLNRLSVRIEKTRQLWDDALFNALRRPLSLLIWLLGISFAADIVGRQTDTAIFGAVAPVRDVGVIAIIAWFFFRLITEVENNIIHVKALEGKGDDVATNQKRAFTCLAMGQKAYLDGDNSTALKHFLQSTKFDPKNDFCHLQLGYCQWRTGRIDDAIMSFARAVALKGTESRKARQELYNLLKTRYGNTENATRMIDAAAKELGVS